jgi:hypothetical protein
MLHLNNKLKIFFLCLFTILNYSIAFSQQLSLKVAGDDQTGFHVDIYNGNQLMVTNSEEFFLQMFNLDLSTVADMQQWKGQTWTGNEKIITLIRDSYVKEFDANLSVSVTCQVVDSNIIKKTIELLQSSIGEMYNLDAGTETILRTNI